MTDFIYFLGRFHVLALHLPIGILLLAVVLEILSRRERFRQLASAASFVWLSGALAAVVTVALGFMHASEGGFDDAAIAAHRNAGISLTVLATIAWLLRSKFERVYAKTWPIWSVSVVIALIVVGHLGGNLTHGDTYLAQYAPGFLQPIFGVSPEQLSRPKPKDVASADIYLDVVVPALAQRCSTCHNDSKRKGGLSLATYAAVMKGGENGKVIVANDAKGSDLYRRITLPHEDNDFMPHDGKTPLTPEQTAAIGWWISIGAPRVGVVADLKPPSEIQTALAQTLGFAQSTALVAQRSQSSEDIEANAPTDVSPADPAAIAALASNGFEVRTETVNSPLLVVDFTANRSVTDADIAALTKIAKQIRELNLRNAGVSDAQLQTIASFENIERLRLELNPITDVGVANLSKLAKLKYLNLYETKITDRGMAILSRLEHLDTLFVWQTGVTAAGVAQFKRTHVKADIDRGFSPERFSAAPKTIPVIN